MSLNNRPLLRKQGLKLKKILRSPFGDQLEMQVIVGRDISDLIV